MNAADAKSHADVIQWVVKFYGPPDWNNEKIEGYISKLARYPLPLVATTANKLIETMPWMPKLSEWLDLIKPQYNVMLEKQRSSRLLIPHQEEPLHLREALAEAAAEGNAFCAKVLRRLD